jgi:hypothetical protein
MYSLIKRPKNGDRVLITWLPENNARPNPNCYIGSEGTVESCDKDGFWLKYDSGASLLVHRHYCYRVQKRYPTFWQGLAFSFVLFIVSIVVQVLIAVITHC